MPEFRMPSLGADMAAGTLTKWYVKPGDTIKRGDTVAVVETDKANVDVESFFGGVVDRLVVQPGEKVPVGTVLAMIRADGEPAAPQPATPAAPARAAAPARMQASPAARKLARESGIDLASVRGTGPHGVIERSDVEHAMPAQTPVPPVPAAVEGLSGMRRAIAAAMSKSNREIPHYYLQTRIDMRTALSYLEQHNAQLSVEQRVLPAALLLKATAAALTKSPHLNGYWVDDQPQFQEGIHIGVVISLRQGGLVIPAIHDADAKGVDEIMRILRELIPRARAGRLKSSEITDTTITVTNLGDLGVETVCGVIYPPQIALVGFGKIVEQPWAHEGMLAVRPVLSATLAADHRATDAHVGAQFLTDLDTALQHPEAL